MQHITCQDGQPVSITEFRAQNPKGTVIIASAFGVSQTYYHAFARHLALCQFDAITFDYRETGQSLGGRQWADLRLADWGAQDIEAIIRFAEQRGLPVSFVGHSIGGQILGLAPSATRLHKMVFIASSAPYWRRWRFPHNLKIWFVANVLLPSVSKFTHQFPNRKMGLGNQDIPAPFVKQWAQWMTKKNYLFDTHFGLATTRYNRLDQAILALGFSDDNLAPPGNIEHLMRFYPRTQSTVNIVAPGDIGASGIGHSGFFKDRFKATLWSETLAWLAQEEA